MECFHSRTHYIWWIAYFFSTLREHILAADVILVARQRILCVCCYSNVNNVQEWDTTLLMRCLATKMTSHVGVFSPWAPVYQTLIWSVTIYLQRIYYRAEKNDNLVAMQEMITAMIKQANNKRERRCGSAQWLYLAGSSWVFARALTLFNKHSSTEVSVLCWRRWHWYLTQSSTNTSHDPSTTSTIDVKNINLQIKNIKTCFFHFYLKTCIKKL